MWTTRNYPVCGSRHAHRAAEYSKVIVSDHVTSDLDYEHSMMTALTHPTTSASGALLRDIGANLMKKEEDFVASITFFIKQYCRESSRMVQMGQSDRKKLALAVKDKVFLENDYAFRQNKYEEQIRDLKVLVAERDKRIRELEVEKENYIRSFEKRDPRMSATGLSLRQGQGSSRTHDMSWRDEGLSPPSNRTGDRPEGTGIEEIIRREQLEEMKTEKILKGHREPILKGLLHKPKVTDDHRQPRGNRIGESSSHGYHHSVASSTRERPHDHRRYYESYTGQQPGSSGGSAFHYGEHHYGT
jgi:hypothetical protein